MLFTAHPVPADEGSAAVEKFAQCVGLVSNRGKPRFIRERAEAAYAVVSAAEPSGLWRVALTISAATMEAAETLCALVAGSLDLADVPGHLVVRGISDGAGVQQVSNSDDLLADLDWSLVTTEVVSALLRPPMREIPGIRAVPYTHFDYNSESCPDKSDPAINFGTILDALDSEAGPFDVPLSTLNRHACVFGATGSGKTWALAPIAAQLIKLNIPVAVLEETKDEWTENLLRELDGSDHAVSKIAPGGVDSDYLPVSLNPLAPAMAVIDGELRVYPLATHAERLRSQLCAAFQAVPPLPQIFGKAITLAYRRKGLLMHLSEQDVSLGRELTFPSMSDVRLAAMDVVVENGYKGEVLSNVMAMVDIRLGSLLEGPGGEFLEYGHPLSIEKLSLSNTVLCLNFVADDAAKMLLSTTFLTASSEYWWLVNHYSKRAEHGKPVGGLRKAIIGDEFHRVAPFAYPGAPWEGSVKVLSDALAEDRAYGIAYIISDQSPTALIPGVIKNTALKVVKRLVDRDDRTAIAGSMNLSQDQEEILVGLDKSVAIVHSDGMDNPIRIRSLKPKSVDSNHLVENEYQAAPTMDKACAAACRTLCTRDTFHGSDVIAARKGLVLISELAVISHLFGYTVRSPSQEWFNRVLRSIDVMSDQFQCAIGRLATQAVRRRCSVIVKIYTPRDLQEHITATLLRLLRQTGEGCPPEPQWRTDAIDWDTTPPRPDAGIMETIFIGDAGSHGVLRHSEPKRSLSPVEDAIYDTSGKALTRPFSEHVSACLNALHADPRLESALARFGEETA
jgi:hypothetical protein